MTDSPSPYTFSPIGIIESCFETKNATPRQPGVAPSGRARLTIDTQRLNNPAFSLDSLHEFSHVWVIFVFHLDEQSEASQGREAPTGTIKSKVAPPRLRGEKVGIFATRTPHRPAPIGLSLVELTDVSESTLTLQGVDLVSGTPVLDIKPYLPTFDDPNVPSSEMTATVRVPKWATPDSIFEHDLEVCFTPRSARQLEEIFKGERPQECLIHSASHMQRLLGEVLSGDPRSQYRRDKCSDRLYFVELDGLHITTWFDESEDDPKGVIAEILRVRES